MPITTAADDIHKYFFIVFLEKIRLDVSSESSARQRIRMKKIKPYFLPKIKEKIKMSSAGCNFCLALEGLIATKVKTSKMAFWMSLL